MRTLRSNLVKLRTDSGLTRKELAGDLGISEISVRKIEEGTRNPSPRMAKKFALYYKRGLDDLFPDIFLVRYDTKRNIKSP